mgnify:CR=1 FL=1
MAKATTIKIRLVSTADTGYFYVTKKNSRTMTEKMSKKKYDPVARKHVEFKDDMEAYLTYTLKPQFRVLGPKVGKKMGAIQKALKGLSGHAAKEELDKTGKLVLHLADGDVTLTPEDVEITMAQTEGYNCQRYGGVTIALETTLSPELIEEGFVREIISKIQTMRKENGYEVTDHIAVSLAGNEKLEALVKKNEDELRRVTLADSVSYGELDGHQKEWNINGETVTLAAKPGSPSSARTLAVP